MEAATTPRPAQRNKNRMSAKKNAKVGKQPAKNLAELVADCNELEKSGWNWEVIKLNLEVIDREASVLLRGDNVTPSNRAEYFAAHAAAKLKAHAPLTAEQLAAFDKSKQLKAQQEATKSLQKTQSVEIVRLGKELLAAVIGTGEKYLNLCKYIRQNEVAQKLVAADLGQLGFSRQTVSKINRVAGASDELWNEFEARSFGFNKMLQLSRGEKPNEATKQLAESMGQDVIEVAAEVKRLEGEDEASESKGESAPETDDEKTAKADLALKRAAAVVARSRVFFKWTKAKVIKFGDGWQMTVEKDTKWKAPKPTTEGGEKSPTMEAKKA